MNFHDYIINDIEEKKTLINVLPKNTELRKKKYISTIDEIKSNYLQNKENVANFIEYKFGKLMPIKQEISIDDKLKEMYKLEQILVLGNNNTTYLEKLEFDILLYQLMHYYDKSLDEVNKLIEEFIYKLEQAKVKVRLIDFRINIYSYMYMSYFFNEYYGKINKVKTNNFENVFWMNRKVIEYIIICFRILLKKNSLLLNTYTKNLLRDKLKINKFSSYKEVKKRYIEIKREIEELKDEDEYDIVKLCLDKTIDINSFIKDSNVRNSDYEYFMINKIDLDNKYELDKFIKGIKNLRYNLEEYNTYLNNRELIDYFKDKYGEKVNTKTKTAKIALKACEKEITRLTKKIFKDSVNSLLITPDINKITDMKKKDQLFKQEQLLDELYTKYIEHNELYFDAKIEGILKENMTVSDIFEIFDSYPYYERRIIKKVYELESENDIDDYINKIKEFIYNPHRKIIDMIPIFVEKNIPQQLMNAYRFENLNINIDSFEETNLRVLFEKSERILRGIKIDKFNLTIDEINFLVNVHTLKNTNIL